MSTATPGLRARKMRQTESEILANAIRQFREQGVRGAQLSQIAEASRVLAEAWIRGEIDELLVNGSRDLGDHGLRSAMRSLCRELASLVARDRSARLEAWREAGRAPSERLSSRHPLVTALSREQERERVRGDISARALGEMLIDAIEGGVIAGLQREDDEAEFAKMLRKRVDLILDGARKKNERVAAPSAGLARR